MVVGVIIAVIICTLGLAGSMVVVANDIEKFVAESMCELMTAVFNAEAIKAKCKEAAKNGQQYVDISEVAK